jgi:hypothetical protein
MAEALVSKTIRNKWEKLGWKYYHTDKDGLKEVFFLNPDQKASVVFKSSNKGRLLLDSANLTIDDTLEDLIDETREELGLL